jgi:peptide/nickel transport system permease protein
VLKYAARRLLIAIPVLWGTTIAVFTFVTLAPGDPVLSMFTPEALAVVDVAQLRHQMGLDRPAPERYVLWLGEVLRGNFGHSYIDGHPVADLIAQRVPATLELMSVALLASLLLSVVLGAVSAMRQHSWLDYVLTLLAFVWASMPEFFLGILLIYLLALKADWLPTSGMATPGLPFSPLDNLRHLALPALVLTLTYTAVFTRYVRSSLLEVLSADYLRTARAKGLRERAVLLRHALRNALLPLITVLGLRLPVLFGGAVIVETVFQWPGMGLLYIQAVNQRDYSLLMGLALISAVFVVLCNLAADLAYGVADPRISYA